MATGYLHNGHCYGTATEAVHAYWSQVPGDVSAGSPSHLSQVVWDGSQFLIQTFSGSTLISSTVAPTPAFVTCDPAESFLDGVQLGGGVGLAVLIAFMIRATAWGTR